MCEALSFIVPIAKWLLVYLCISAHRPKPVFRLIRIVCGRIFEYERGLSTGVLGTRPPGVSCPVGAASLEAVLKRTAVRPTNDEGLLGKSNLHYWNSSFVGDGFSIGPLLGGQNRSDNIQ